MSGTVVYHALHERFEAIRHSELDRLHKKLRPLSDADRQIVEAVTADVIRAIVQVPGQTLNDDTSQRSLDALVRLFALEA
jgi:glutamyl-tRNA reductase